MRFDFGSFIIGVVIAFAISYVAYKRRDQLSALWQRIRSRLEALKIQLTEEQVERLNKAGA